MKALFRYTDNLILRTLKIRQGDRRKVFGLQAVIFLIITVLLILKSVFTGLLLSDYGIQIVPKAYVLIAITAVVSHLIIMKLGEGTNIYGKLQGNFLIQAGLLFTIGIFIMQDWGRLSLVYYIYMSLFALVTVTFFYQYCQSILSIREAKRLLGYIGAGAIAGGIFGGYLASLLVDFIGNAGLIFLSFVILIATYFIARSLNTFDEVEPEDVKFTKSFTSLLYTLKHRHVVNIVFIIGLGVIAAKFADYQFNFLLAEVYEGSEDLTGYLGFWLSTINVAGLLIQLLLMNPVVDRLGVSRSMQILPSLIILSSLLLLAFPVLSFGLLLKGVDGSLKQSVYKSTTELFTMPLPPELRGRAKSFVDVVIDSLATGIAGLVIIGLSSVVISSLTAIGVCTILVSIGWVYFIYRGSFSYEKMLERMVAPFEEKIDRDEEEDDEEKKEWRERVRQAVSRINRFRGDIIEKAPSILGNFKFRGKKILIGQLYDNIQTAGDLDRLYSILTNNEKLILTATVARSIGKSSRKKELYKLHSKIEKCISYIEEQSFREEMSDKLMHQLYLAICHARYKERYKLVKLALQSESNIVRQRYALHAVRDSRLRKMFYQLDFDKIDVENQVDYYKTLAAFPTKTHALLKLLLEKNKRKFVRILPACRYIPSQRNVDILFKFMDEEHEEVRKETLITLNELRKQYPQFNYRNRLTERRLNRQLGNIRKLITTKVTLLESKELGFIADNRKEDLIKGIDRSLNSAMVQVFIYLSMLTGRYDLEIVYKSVKEGNENKALDFLDGVLDFKLKSKVIPVLEALLIHEHNSSNLSLIGVDDIYTLPRTYEYLVSLVGNKASGSIGEIFRGKNKKVKS